MSSACYQHSMAAEKGSKNRYVKSELYKITKTPNQQDTVRSINQSTVETADYEMH